MVRLSGPLACQLGRDLAPDLPPPAAHRLARRTLRSARGEPLDDALLVHFHAPRSYTGENVVELHLHGGLAVVEAVLQRCLELGARQARPGEFTERAFLAGRIDLAQAEAVAALIAAEGEGEHRAALQQLSGGLSRRVDLLIARLSAQAAALRAALDFPLEAVEPDAASGPEALPPLATELAAVTASLAGMLAQARLPALARPPRVVLCGPPNAGKSTLLNAWLHQDRVLVDAQPGTTRDPVAASLQRAGMRLQVVDTAGIRPAADADGVEQRGMAMSARFAAEADLVLWLLPVDADPDLAASWPPESWPSPIVVASKSDLATFALSRQQACAAARALEHWGCISARSGAGTEALADKVLAVLRAGQRAPSSVHLWPVSQRQTSHLEAAVNGLGEIQSAGLGHGADDVVLMRLEEAMGELGQMIGRDVERGLTELIFAQFCIGK